MAEQTLDVIAFNRFSGTVLYSNGSSGRIGVWLDDDGDECGPADSPVVAVTEADGNGQYHTLVLSEFEAVEMH